MQATFYSFAKKRNSTALPSGGTTLSIELKEDECSVLSPSILLRSAGPLQYNYVYIPLFGRYYYISNMIIRRNGLIEFICEVDVMASWRSAIINTEWYVSRSSVDYDLNITDTYYITNDVINSVVNIQPPWYIANPDDPDPAQATYQSTIVGVIGNKGGRGVDYYYTTELPALMRALFSTTDWMGIASSDLAPAMQKSLINPMQYVQGAYIIPARSTALIAAGKQSTISLGWWDFTVSGYRLTGGSLIKYSFGTDIPEHPQVKRGKYLNVAPYSRYYLYAPPFGTIELDSTYMLEGGKLQFDISLSPVPGTAYLKISIGGKVLQTLSASMAIPLTLAAQTQNALGANAALWGGSADIASKLLTGNIGGAVGSFFGTLANVGEAGAPKVQTIGGTPDFSMFNQQWQLLISRQKIAPENLSHVGRPCCKNLTPSIAGTGFYMVADPDFDIGATPSEKQQISSYLTGGFFYE